MYRAARKGTRHVRDAIQPWPVTVLFIGWCFRYVLVAVFAPGCIRTSGRWSVADRRHARQLRVLPLDSPGIVSIPLAFFLGWPGSVTGRQPSHPARFARVQVRALTGVGAERGGHN
jgi:Na+(H+)/acetate symporter ActP